jgi:antitoxin MazE
LTIKLRGINIVATGVHMEIAIRSIGNSKGVVIPKPLLSQAGLEDQATANIVVENGCIVLSKPAKDVRAGWAEAAAVVAAQGEDDLLMGDFGNLDDASLTW